MNEEKREQMRGFLHQLAGLTDPERYETMQSIARLSGLVISVSWNYDGETLTESICFQSKEEALQHDPVRLMEENQNLIRQNVELLNQRNHSKSALSDLLHIIETSIYGEESIHHHTCPAPDHGKCSCGAYEAVDTARKTLEGVV